MKKSGTFWAYALMFASAVIGFVMAEFRNDVQQMIWCGFLGMLWFRIAEREANA